MKVFKKISILWSIIKVYKYSVFFLFLIMLASALSETLGLGMIMPLLEIITNPAVTNSRSLKYLSPILKYFSEYHWFLVIGLLLVILILIKNILGVCKVAFSAYLTSRFRRLWQSVIMEKYMYAEYNFILSSKQGFLLNNLLLEPAHAAKLLQQLIEFISTIILTFFLYSLLLLVNREITLVLTLILAVIMFITRKTTGNYALDVGRKKVSFSQELNIVGAENISAIRQVKIFSLEKEVCRKFNQTVDRLIQTLIKFRIVTALSTPIIETLVVISTVFILAYIQYFVKLPLTNIIPIAGLFIVISQKLFPNISSIFVARMEIIAHIPSLKLVQDLYTKVIQQERLDEGRVLESLEKDIVFEGVYFSYVESSPLFRGLNITVPKGKITAIVGPSGSGKTTIVDLLTGFFRQDSGNILINGYDISKINLLSWRKLVGYIPQDSLLFNTTVQENILVGKLSASQEEIICAAQKAHADEFIRELPKGYDTVLGDRGMKISGGQRQRIAIARALIRNPELLIFDEATSSLDRESEKLIQQSISELSGKKTIIIISHRPSTVENADIIYFLDKGEITELETFAEFKERKDRFHKIRAA